jgi:predicted DNA-binding transcriptional regulator AlpA
MSRSTYSLRLYRPGIGELVGGCGGIDAPGPETCFEALWISSKSVFVIAYWNRETRGEWRKNRKLDEGPLGVTFMRKPDQSGLELLKVGQVSALLNMSVPWVYAHANGNRLPHLPSKKIGGARRFALNEVMAFVAACSQKDESL